MKFICHIALWTFLGSYTKFSEEMGINHVFPAVKEINDYRVNLLITDI